MKKIAEKLKQLVPHLRSRRDYGSPIEDEENIKLVKLSPIVTESDSGDILYEITIKKGLFTETYTVRADIVPDIKKVFNLALGNIERMNSFYERFLKDLKPIEETPKNPKIFKDILKMLNEKRKL